MADNFKSGRTGTAMINGNEVALTRWRINPTTETVRFRNSHTSKFSKVEQTFYELTGTIEVDYDQDAPLSGSPTNVVVGALLTNVKLITAGGTAGTNFWLIPSALVTSTPQELVIDGKTTTSFDFINNGTFSYPGGAVPV
jgi:hypothetical protein